MKLLRIDASARLDGSHSRDLGDHFCAALRDAVPNLDITVRDLATKPTELIQDTTIVGFYTPGDEMTSAMRQATALSDQLIDELQAADTLLLTVPMYNFSIPAALKAWIDQVVRINHTFSYNGTAFTGLVKARQAYVVCAYGAAGYAPGEGFEAANFLQPYMQFLLQFLGIDSIDFAAVQATTADEQTVATNTTTAKEQIDQWVMRYA